MDTATLPLHALFAAQAGRTPSAIAVCHADHAVTYRELLAWATAIRRSLVAHGIVRGQVVGLHMDRSAAWVAAMLAVLDSEASVLPLPPAFPTSRLRDVIAAAKPAVVLEHPDTPWRADESTSRLPVPVVPPFEEGAEMVASGDADATAFVLFSSGSTGVPKLIARSHRSFQHRLRWTWEQQPFTPLERCAQKAHMTTTHALYELFEPLLRGVPIEIIPDDVARDLEQFWRIVRTRGVSRLLLVPSALRATLDMPGFVAPPLRVVVLMGEYVAPELAALAMSTFPPETRLYSIYGSTEASSTLVCDLRQDWRSGRELPLGMPITPDITASVLDTRREPVAPGAVGRLFLAGPALFSEYVGNPEATSAVLIDRPGDARPLFDTRDDVRLSTDGSLEFVGRADHTVKIRGFRVDLLDVEQAMRRHSEVREVAAIARQDDAGIVHVHGFVAPASVGTRELYTMLRALLPSYMVPSSLHAMEALPRTSSGKPDRPRLLAVLHERPTTGASAHTYANDTETRIATAWQAILGHAQFSREDAFFEVGGSSLMVFALVHRLRAEFGLEPERLDAHDVYAAPTIAALADRLGTRQAGAPPTSDGDASSLVTLRRGSDPEVPPLFVIASAGGTLGAYEPMIARLRTPREIVGVPDPYLWGARDPLQSFDEWVDGYVRAIQRRQPGGPTYLCAYSSAGAFGIEAAQRLGAHGNSVPLLILIDPLALAFADHVGFGHRAFSATWKHPVVRAFVRLVGRFHAAGFGLPRRATRQLERPTPLTRDQLRARMSEARQSKGGILNLSALFELNTGLPFTLEPEDLERVDAGEALDVFLTRAAALGSDLDARWIARIVEQYPLQVGAQHHYDLRPYTGDVLLIEPETPYGGLLALLLRRYMPKLEAVQVPLGAPSERVRSITERFGPLAAHYRCMRDPEFVQGAARLVEQRLGVR